MKSGKQRRAEIISRRQLRAKAKTMAAATGRPMATRPHGSAVCNPAALAPSNSYSVPAFVTRGWYEDLPFCCKDCGAEEIWRATQQKWWYEVAKGDVATTAVRCRVCRRRERDRQRRERERSFAGQLAKAQRQGQA